MFQSQIIIQNTNKCSLPTRTFSQS